MPINISILGSTGSIGTQVLEVASEFNKSLNVIGLAAGTNLNLLKKQIKKYHPKAVSVKEEKDAQLLQKSKTLKSGNIHWGNAGNLAVATLSKVNKVIIATPGLAGINPTLLAIKNKKTIALATKEVLVSAGNIVMRQAKKHGAVILPIDSEHSAIFQCLEGRTVKEINKIILTASGGPFRGMKPKQLKKIGLRQALNHPNWKMGKKITIDSATLMNKGFEVIEALWLFGVPLNKIKVIVHPQSVIHSAVEFKDGTIIVQMGPSDMRLPIQHALLYPAKRQANSFRRFSFNSFLALSFEEPDTKTFRCLDLAYKAIGQGKTMPAVLTAANDVAVKAFLDKRIPFLKIPDIIESTLVAHTPYPCSSIDVILEADKWAREKAAKFVVKFGD